MAPPGPGGDVVVLLQLGDERLSSALRRDLHAGWQVSDDGAAPASLVVTDSEDAAVVRFLRASQPRATIVAVGNRGDPTSVLAMLEAGAACYLRDPSAASVIRRLRAALAPEPA